MCGMHMPRYGPKLWLFFTWIMMGYSLYFQFWNRLVCFLGYVILPGLVLFSSCYTIKGMPLDIALGHWIFLIIFLHIVVISVNLRFSCFVCWGFSICLFALMCTILILGVVKAVKNIVAINFKIQNFVTDVVRHRDTQTHLGLGF